MVLFSKAQLAVLVRPTIDEIGVRQAAKKFGVSRETLTRIVSDLPVTNGSIATLSVYFSGSNQPQPEAPAH